MPPCPWDGQVSTSPLPLWLWAGASSEPGWAAFASLERLQGHYKERALVCSLYSPRALARPVQGGLGLLLTPSLPLFPFQGCWGAGKSRGTAH